MRILLFINDKKTIVSINEVRKPDFEDCLYLESNKYLIKVEFLPKIDVNIWLEKLLKFGFLDLIENHKSLVHCGIDVIVKDK